jgi:hypothetical protein
MHISQAPKNQRAPKGGNMRRPMFRILLFFILGSPACRIGTMNATYQATDTPNAARTEITEAIISTITGEIPTTTTTESAVPPTVTPDHIATGVAEAKAIAATLTAEVPIAPTIVTKFTSAERIYFSIRDVLYQMDLDGSDLQVVTRGIGNVNDLVIDMAQKKIYLTHWDQPAQIRVLDLQNIGEIKVFSDGLTDGLQGIAIDPSGANMYLGIYYAGVYVMRMDHAGAWNQLVDSSSLSPMLGQRGQLQIDPAKRQIYFRSAFNGECGECRYIWRVDFEGNNLTKIILANGGDALALDLSEKKMYFSDYPGDYTIKRANLDGSRVETLLTLPEPYRFCKIMVLDVPHRKMYLSLYNNGSPSEKRAIARANLDGSDYEILAQLIGTNGDEVAGGIALYLP